MWRNWGEFGLNYSEPIKTFSLYVYLKFYVFLFLIYGNYFKSFPILSLPSAHELMYLQLQESTVRALCLPLLAFCSLSTLLKHNLLIIKFAYFGFTSQWFLVTFLNGATITINQSQNIQNIFIPFKEIPYAPFLRQTTTNLLSLSMNLCFLGIL